MAAQQLATYRMSLFEMRDMRDLGGTCQRELELELDGRSWTDPMNSDMAGECGYQNSEKGKKRTETEEEMREEP